MKTMPDIHRARSFTRALLNYADNLRVIDAARYGTIADQIERMAQPAFDALRETPAVAQPHMIGCEDE
jgi:hypothetical protein